MTFSSSVPGYGFGSGDANADDAAAAGVDSAAFRSLATSGFGGGSG